jgi:uncharacterized protein (DUF924 family)
VTFDPEAVLAFWFDDDPVGRGRSEWWRKDPNFDEQIRQRFGDAWAAAAAGELDAWQSEPRSALALVVLLDQFSRNLWRDDARTWAQDDRALRVARGAVDAGHDAALRPIEACILYMPFMHAEDREAQAESMRLFEQLAAGVPEEYRETYDRMLHYAVLHRDIVDRFGRYPHRNAILGRPSTPEEEAFLKEPNSSF